MGTLEVSTVIAVVAAVKTIAHSETVVVAAMTVSGTIGASVIPTTSTVHTPAVSTVVGKVEVWPSEIEIGAVRVTGVDAEVPVACAPVEGAIEVRGIQIQTILPIEEDIAQVEITALPIDAIEVVLCVYAHEVIEVYLVGCFILLFREVELIGHLVGQEQSLLAGLLVAHGACRCYECEQCHKGGHHLLHILVCFKLFIIYFRCSRL